MITRIVRNFGFVEVCFYVETAAELMAEELKMLRWVIAETFEPELIYERGKYDGDNFVEIGPRLNVETPFSTNAVSICHSWGLKKVTRIEQSRIFKLADATREKVIAKNLDQMTQIVYPASGIASFELDLKPDEMQIIPVLENGEEAIRKANKQLGLGMDEWDVTYYTEIFSAACAKSN